METIRRQSGIYSDGACRRRHQYGGRAGSQLDRPSASIDINNLTIPGLQTRRAKTTVELRDGELRAGWPSAQGFPVHRSSVPDPGLDPDHRHAVPSTASSATRRSCNSRHAAPRAPGAAADSKVPTDRVKPPNEAEFSSWPDRHRRPAFRRSGRRSGSGSGATPPVARQSASRPVSRRSMAMNSKLLMIVPLAVGLAGCAVRSGYRFLRSWWGEISRVRGGGSDHTTPIRFMRGRRLSPVLWRQGPLLQ